MTDKPMICPHCGYPADEAAPIVCDSLEHGMFELPEVSYEINPADIARLGFSIPGPADEGDVA